jgi:hypothetical protein
MLRFAGLASGGGDLFGLRQWPVFVAFCFADLASVGGDSLGLRQWPAFVAFCCADLTGLRADPVMACGEQSIGAGECENGQAK